MEIFHGIDDPLIRRPTVLTLGVFDGLHLGHQAIVHTVVERALLINATPTLITFDPHPRQVLKPETAPPLLQTFHQKMEGLKNLGMGQVVVLDFTPELADLAAVEFVQRFICDGLMAEVYSERASPSVTIDRAISRSFEISAKGLVFVRVKWLKSASDITASFDYDSPAA